MLLFCAGLHALGGCAEPTRMRDGREVARAAAADADLRDARDAAEGGRDEVARRILERFLAESPDGRRADEARFLLANVYLRGGDAERAAGTWRQLVERAPLSRLAPEAGLRAAEVYRDLGDPAAGRRLLAGVDLRRAPASLRGSILHTLADLNRASGDFSGAVVALAGAREYESGSIDAELSELIEERLRDSELEAVLQQLPRGDVSVRVTLELARRRIAQGEYASAVALLDPLETLEETEHDARGRLLDRARRGATSVIYPLGLEVPLSGRFAAYGQSVLRGVTLGLDLFGEPAGDFRLVIRDTTSEASGAGEATRGLIQEGVRAIIGPLGSSPAMEAAPIAGEAGVPMLALTVRSDLPYAGSGIFRTGVASMQQVRTLVEFAMEALEAQRFAVLYPDDAYGSEYKNLLWEEVERRGGEIVGSESYDPAAVDLQDSIRKLVGLYHLTPDERRRVKRREELARRRDEHREELASPEFADLPPYVDFDALFIPEAAAKVGLILPQLRYYDVTDVILLGSSDWNDPKLLELAPREAEGAIFVSAFNAASEDDRVQEFVAAYRAAYGDAPDEYAAQGYETASLIRSLVREGRAPTARELADALHLFPSGPSTFRPIAGLEGFDASGAAIRDLSILTVHRREICEYEADASALMGRE
jgi:branched-chain amino acid transport system substrate-binding protein